MTVICEQSVHTGEYQDAPGWKQAKTPDCTVL